MSTTVQQTYMGRIVVEATIENGTDPSCRIVCDVLVDTGAAYLTLPNAWRPRLGRLTVYDTVNVETANQAVVTGDICGPVLLRFGKFRQVLAEVLFIRSRLTISGARAPASLKRCRAGEDILPPEYGFAPILRLVDFEIRQWIFAPDATDRMGRPDRLALGRSLMPALNKSLSSPLSPAHAAISSGLFPATVIPFLPTGNRRAPGARPSALSASPFSAPSPLTPSPSRRHAAPRWCPT